MTKKLFLSVLLLAVFLLGGFFLVNHQSGSRELEDIKYVRIGGQDIKTDLAITGAEHEQGLSGREKLKDDEGMLFIFDIPAKYNFWMKDMKFPIDMIWISADMKIVYIKKNALPEKYPEIYGPASSAKYVLEVIAGFSDKNNLKEGDSVLFTY